MVVVLLPLGCDSTKTEGYPNNTKTKEQPKIFSLTNPQETGLFFINEVNEDNQMNVLVYEYLYNGAGVALGDVNNDGLTDVFFSGNLFGGRLFLNKGELKFEQISETAGVYQNGWSTGVSMVDINEDGYDDIYICRSLAGNPELRRNVLLINNQDNTFTNRAAEYGLDDPSFSNYATWFDYDKDGDLDMYLLNHRIDFTEAQKLKYTTNAQGETVKFVEEDVRYFTDKLYRNNGNGRFTDVTEKAGLVNRAFGLSVTTADIDQDGWTDLYVANDFGDKDHFYINNGDGTFSDRIDEMFFHMSKNAMGSDIADFNNDGLPDLVNLDMMAEDNYRQKLLKGQVPYDLYQLSVDYGLGHQVMRNTLQLNNGNGTFSEIGQLAGISHTDWSWTPLLADFDNDGMKDLFISNGFLRDLTDMDYMNYGSAEAMKRLGGTPREHALELTQMMKSNPIPNYVYENNGDLTFTDRSASWGVNQAAFSNGAVYADLDQDGDLDLITNNFNSEAFLYKNNARELGLGNYIAIRLQGDRQNPHGIGAKVSLETPEGLQYQEVNPYRGYFSSGSSVVHFGLGQSGTVASVTVEWPNGSTQILTNVAANQQLVLKAEDGVNIPPMHKQNISPILRPVSDDLTRGFTHTEDDFIDFKREPLLEHQISNKGPFVAQADVNADGQPDLYLGGAADYPGRLYLSQPDGSYAWSAQPAFESDAAYEDAQAAWLDVDRDGDMDLFVASGGYKAAISAASYVNRLYLNDGQGSFSRASNALSATRQNSTAVVAADFDGDGDEDLFIGGGALPGSYPYPARCQLLLNVGGQFEDATASLPADGQPGMVNDALWMDVDADGQKELLLAGEWMPLTAWKWQGGAFKQVPVKGFGQTAGWWNVLEAADVDGDGDLDVIAGNRGSNSFYRASAEQPARIYAKDFDQNGQVDAFPFYYFNDGQAHPKHVLNEVAAQYPPIRRKFTRYTPYAQAGLDDIFSPEELKDALVLEALTFHTTLFENQADGTFTPRPLPNRAQFSEVHGILAQDLNGDGHQDLLLTGNNYEADVEAGRNDASIGTVLLGNGVGGFAALAPAESGFSVPGDTRGTFMLQGKIYVLVNNGTPYAFEVAQ